MSWDQDIDLNKRKLSSRLIVERALARGWKVRAFDTNSALHLIYVPGRQAPIKIFSASPPQMSIPASKIAQDKYITNQILRDENIPVPDEMLIDRRLPLDQEGLEKFLSKHKRVVVKPLDASHGKGVTIGIQTVAELVRALETARLETRKNNILVQQQLSGHDVRILIIGYEYCDAINRIHASVIGDGLSTIRELIEQENQSDERGINYTARLNVIPMEKAEEYLGTEGLEFVPANGEQVQVIGVANIGMGGERSNVKKVVPDFLRDIALRVARTLELPVCGVDFMVKNLPQSDSTPEQLNAHIIEVNACPMLTMYEDLYSPEQTRVIDSYLDYIAS